MTRSDASGVLDDQGPSGATRAGAVLVSNIRDDRPGLEQRPYSCMSGPR